MTAPLKPFWVSWWGDRDVEFTWHGPWWISGWRGAYGGDDDQPSICAAVMATDQEHAMRQLVDAHDRQVTLEWRSANEREAGWQPWSDRFPRAGWMKWPWPVEPHTGGG